MSVEILTGDCRALLATLAGASVQCCITSPPYFGLRDYGVAGQIGLEPSLDAYIITMVEVFREARRVLRDDGTCWVNLGDGMRDKQLLMVPARVALALQADGWWLRSEIVWSKPNPMPESVTDRPTSAHEKIYLLTKSARYFYDNEAVREPSEQPHRVRADKFGGASWQGRQQHSEGATFNGGTTRNMRNVWEIATEAYAAAHFATFPTALAERCIKAGTSERGCCAQCGAPWVRETERSVAFTSGSGRAGNVPNGKHAGAVQALSGDYDIRMGPSVSTTTTGWSPSCACNAAVAPCVVLDPFAGAATTLLVAQRLGRSAIGIELSPAYVAMAWQRLQAESPYERINPMPDNHALAGPLLAWAPA